MPANEGQNEAHDVSTNVALRAIFSVLAAQREKALDHGDARTEILLAGAGIGYKDIATLLGKNPDAVRMLINRASKQPSGGATPKQRPTKKAAKRA